MVSNLSQPKVFIPTFFSDQKSVLAVWNFFFRQKQVLCRCATGGKPGANRQLIGVSGRAPPGALHLLPGRVPYPNQTMFPPVSLEIPPHAGLGRTAPSGDVSIALIGEFILKRQTALA